MADDERHDGDEFDDEGGFDEDQPMDEHEATLIQRDLEDLTRFEDAFRPEGYRGVSVFCQDCVEEHFYEWDMLRENLRVLIESGETPVHEPAFAPDPGRYVPWDYARGYVDALDDAGVGDRVDAEGCSRCGLVFDASQSQANFCPRCGSPLLTDRVASVLIREFGFNEEELARLFVLVGLPPRR